MDAAAKYVQAGYPGAQVFGEADTESTWKIKAADRKSLLNLH